MLASKGRLVAQVIEWLIPWHAEAEDDPQIQATWESELSREVCSQHDLFGESVKLIARRQDMDQALFSLSDGRVADVHLTWIGKIEKDARWPVCEVHDSIEQWVRETMTPTHGAWITEK